LRPGPPLVKNLGELRSLFSERSWLADELVGMLEAALRAVDPRVLLSRKVEVREDALRVGGVEVGLAGYRRVLVVSVGKAAPGLARGMLDILGGHVDRCIVVAPLGADASILGGEAEVYFASHPIPDESGLRASQALLGELGGMTSDTLVILLLSGGSSALLPAPAEDLTLRDEAEVTRLLLSSGATIEELNVVRKHVSAVKGGQLARAMMPARVLALILSDVPGDRLDVVGSGLTAPDPSTFRDAYEVLVRRGVWDAAPPPVRRRIEAGVAGLLGETPKPGDPVFERVTNVLIGGVGDALEAAAEAAEAAGYRAEILARSFEGEATSIGLLLGSVALERRPGTVLLLGGESTVRVVGGGKGGRNQELALAALTRLRPDSDGVVVSVGTDGLDGPTDAAGAVACREVLEAAGRLGLKPREYLERNDSYSFFRQASGHIVTGPTGTNVGDVALVLYPRP